MKKALRADLAFIFIAALALTSCAPPVEGKVVSIPNSIGAHQVVNGVLGSCTLPGGQNGLVTRNTYWTQYQGNGASEVTDLSALAVVDRGNCTAIGDIVVDDSKLNELAEVTDPGQKQESIQRLCDASALGTAEGDAFIQEMRDMGSNLGPTQHERFCKGERK